MGNFLTGLFVSLVLLTGCGQEGAQAPAEIRAFIEELKADGVDGSLFIRAPFNADMEYVAEYTVSRYASTRIISLFKFKNAEKAEANLQEAMNNEKLSGQAANGKFVMVITFHPPDEAAVEKIKVLFLAHGFE